MHTFTVLNKVLFLCNEFLAFGSTSISVVGDNPDIENTRVPRKANERESIYFNKKLTNNSAFCSKIRQNFAEVNYGGCSNAPFVMK